MPAAQSIARPIAVALASILIAGALLDCAFATEPGERSFVIAQSSLGGPEQLPPLVAPTPPNYSPPSNSPPSNSPPNNSPTKSAPRVDFIPPGPRPEPAPPLNTSPQTDFVPPGLRPNQPSPNSGGDLYF